MPNRASYPEQCVIADNWLYNQSNLDVQVNIDGFNIKVPAGKRILCTGWDQVRRSVEDMDQEEFYGCTAPVSRSGFQFVTGHRRYIYNDLVVFSPDSARPRGGRYAPPGRTLEEHIALINEMKLEKATIISEDLSFLPRCPSLRSLSIKHAIGLEQPLDFSPLYELPELERLRIDAPGAGDRHDLPVQIDLTRIRGLRHLSLCTKDLFNFPLVSTLETLSLSNEAYHPDMTALSSSLRLKQLELLQCTMQSLNGIEQYPLQALSLSHLRRMEDISALSGCAGTLRMLSIDACGKIRDFSCLEQLTSLEYLQLHGRNVLPDLRFLNEMPKLKVFNFTMTVADGDLIPCLSLPYATFSGGKRNYNLKDRDLPKNADVSGFSLI